MYLKCTIQLPDLQRQCPAKGPSCQIKLSAHSLLWRHIRIVDCSRERGRFQPSFNKRGVEMGLNIDAKDQAFSRIYDELELTIVVTVKVPDISPKSDLTLKEIQNLYWCIQPAATSYCISCIAFPGSLC